MNPVNMIVKLSDGTGEERVFTMNSVWKVNSLKSTHIIDSEKLV